MVDHLQIVAAALAGEHHPGSAGGRATGTPVLGAGSSWAAASPTASPPATPAAPSASADSDYRDCADFLRGTLGISRAEARRRLSLVEVVLPGISPSGATLPPRLEALGEAVAAGVISGRAATVVAQALDRVQSFATPQQRDSMEHHLTRQAIETDEDILRVLARRWESVLDQDGQEPTEKVLRARQGVFLKGRRHGLHLMEIGATDEQFEHLVTVMNSAANPRGSSGHTAGSIGGRVGGTAGGSACDEERDPSVFVAGSSAITRSHLDPGLDPVTRAQSLLDGLVSACKIALASAELPAAGGHRPQVMVTIDYKDLLGETQRAGNAVFAEQITARNIRKLACDADLIPLVLGGKGQVLDVGRAQRLFPPHLRRALVARDKGCAFPDCSMPASWCEAHHMRPWSRGGSTSIDNGVLLCSRHHHVIHQDLWTVEPRGGIPWFRAPGRPGRAGVARRNTYWQAGQVVDEELAHSRFRPDPGSGPGPGPGSGPGPGPGPGAGAGSGPGSSPGPGTGSGLGPGGGLGSRRVD